MICQNCNKREATQTYTDDMMSFIHGMSAQWCMYCVLTTQLAFARKQADRIPIIENDLKIELELIRLEEEEK